MRTLAIALAIAAPAAIFAYAVVLATFDHGLISLLGGVAVWVLVSFAVGALLRSRYPASSDAAISQARFKIAASGVAWFIAVVLDIFNGIGASIGSATSYIGAGPQSSLPSVISMLGFLAILAAMVVTWRAASAVTRLG